MNNRTYISESEKSQILTLHESVRNKNNYFETLENKIQKVLLEKHEPPKLQPGESMTEDGKILSVKKVKKPDLLVNLNVEFDPGKFEDKYVTLSEEDKTKIKNWFDGTDFLDAEISVTVIAGSSKSGPGKTDEERKTFNTELAQKRADTGNNVIKTYLDTILDPELQSQVKYSEDITGAHQGPEYIPGKNRSTEPQYQQFQFVKIRISAKGEVNIESERETSFQPWRVLPIGNLPNIGFVEFCVSGFYYNETNRLYMCPNNGWKALYYSNNGDKVVKGTTRWIPIPPSDTKRGIVWTGSQAESGTGDFAGGAMKCFQYETSGKDKENCQAFYDKWPNYSYRYKEGKEGNDWSIPGKEVGEDMYQKIITNWGTTYAQQ